MPASIVRSFFTLFCLVMAVSIVSADTFHVGAGGDCDANTISAGLFLAALNGAGSDTIYIVRDQAYTDQHAFVSNQSVSLVGGVDDCSDITPSGTTTISGLGGASDVVIEYSFTTAGPYFMDLTNLTIRDGETGGISVHGVVEARVRLLSAFVTGNSGPGITVTGSEAEVSTDGQSSVTYNLTSSNGAGVSCTDGSFIAQGTIAHNETTGLGGGIFGSGCTVRLSNIGASTIVEWNTALVGGGIYLESGAWVGADLDTGSSELVLIRNNTAESGGGLYLIGGGTASSLANVRIVDNVASGSGGGVTAAGGADFSMHGNRCPQLYRCSQISSNRAGSNRGGGAVFLDSTATGSIVKTFIESNSSTVSSPGDTFGSAIAVNPGSTMTLDSVVLATNDGVSVIDLAGTGAVNGNGLTSTDNLSSAGSHHFLRMDASATATLGFSIVTDEVRASNNGALTVNGLLMTSPSPYVSGSNIQTGDPLFADAPAGDYQLSETSPAVDIALGPYTTNNGRDLLDEFRGVFHHDPAAPFDLGAFEYLPLFLDGFESGDLGRWSTSVGGS